MNRKFPRVKRFSLVCIFFGGVYLLIFWACGQNSPDGKTNVVQNKNSPTKPDGLTVFRRNCMNCHGNDGKLGLNGAKDLTQTPLSLDERILIITNGRNAMAPWEGLLSPEEIRAVASYTGTLK